ncbi:MAG: ATP-dependent DNA ligase [Pseudomonadota bacterium]|nr:ATP-dependent DNA ligase [Pseudomonadota bacterium]
MDAIEPMEAKNADALPDGIGWQYEPKWDGFRCLAFIADGDVRLVSKAGKPLGRYFPEVIAGLAGLPDCVLDGELIIPFGPTLSFEALQMRLHPAESRVRKLSVETPARLMLFDLLKLAGKALATEPLAIRRKALERLYAEHRSGLLRLSPTTDSHDIAQRWLAGTGSALDGVIAKRSDEAYRPGERAMVKVKRMRTADCVVGGFRYATKKKEVATLLLGLFDKVGVLHHVGHCSGLSAVDKAELTHQLEGLVGRPGFTGDAPGGPSRWATRRTTDWQPLRSKLVVEVRFDHVTGARFRHGTGFLRWRPDKRPEQCTMEQLGDEARPTIVDQAIVGA